MPKVELPKVLLVDTSMSDEDEEEEQPWHRLWRSIVQERADQALAVQRASRSELFLGGFGNTGKIER